MSATYSLLFLIISLVDCFHLVVLLVSVSDLLLFLINLVFV